MMQAWWPQPIPGGALELKLSKSCPTFGQNWPGLSILSSIIGYRQEVTLGRWISAAEAIPTKPKAVECCLSVALPDYPLCYSDSLLPLCPVGLSSIEGEVNRISYTSCY